MGEYLKNNGDLFGRAYVPLFWAGLVGCYLKSSLMQDYWPGIARWLGQKEVPTLVALSYFSLDILVNFFLVPCAVLAIAIPVFRNRAPFFTTAVSCFLIIFYFIQLRAQQDVGQYLSPAMMYEAARFAATESELASRYIPVGAAVKLFLALIATVSCTLLVAVAARSSALATMVKTGLRAMAGLLAVLLAGAVIAYPANGGGLHRAAVQKILASMSAETFVSSRGEKTLEEYLAAFRQLTNTPGQTGDAAPIGKQANSNILYFIMETGPAEVFANADATELIPPELAQNSLVAHGHQTTYPYTSDAIFSILSGFYPEGRRELVARGGFKKHKVLFARLRDRGYQTGAYVQAITDENVDEKMLRQFGLNTVFVANRHTSDSPELQLAKVAAEKSIAGILGDSPYFEPDRKPWMSSLLTNDLHALERMKSDMRATIRAGKNFAHLFLPQIGHGPWLQIGGSPDRKAYGRALMKMQALWLRDLVKMLQDEGALKNTVIVFTADHGVRTRTEDPDFKVGTISSYSFHVPLIVFAPSAFREPLAVRTLTSHIDLESSISLLLGFQSGSDVTEGVPLWDRPANRRLYFFAGNYGGADGFYHGDYFMNNVITEAQFQSSIMDFSTPGLNLTDPKKQDFVTKAISDFKILHRGIFSAL